MKSASKLAKHTSKEDFFSFIPLVKSLLVKDGTCWIIIPHTQLDLLVHCAKRVSLYIINLVIIDAKESKPNSRVIIALSNVLLLSKHPDWLFAMKTTVIVILILI